MRVGALAVRRTGIVGLGVGSRERLVVGVPRLLVIVRHAVVIGLIVTVLWFLVASADTTAADVIPTGWVVVISVRLLVRVITLLRVVRHRLHAVTTSAYVVCAVRILLKHLPKKYTTKKRRLTTSQVPTYTAKM